MRVFAEFIDRVKGRTSDHPARHISRSGDILSPVALNSSTRRRNDEDVGSLRIYAYFIACVWTVVVFVAVFLCRAVVLFLWDTRLPLSLLSAIASGIMTAAWVALAIKARRRGYTDLSGFRLEVAFLLSLVFLLSLWSLFDVPQTGRYLTAIPFTAAWAAVRYKARSTKRSSGGRASGPSANEIVPPE